MPRRARDVLLYLNDLFLLWDGCAGFAIGYAAELAYRHFGCCGGPSGSPSPAMLHEMVMSSVIAALLLREARLATEPALLRTGPLLAMLTRRLAASALVLLAAGWASGALADMARLWLAGWFAGFAVWVFAGRLLYVWAARRLQRDGRARETVAVIGMAGTAGPLASRLGPEVDVIRVVDCGLARAKADPVSPAIAEMLGLAQAGGIDTVVLANAGDPEALAPILECLQPMPVQVALSADLHGLSDAPAGLRSLSGVPLAILSDRPRKRWQLLLKGVLDRSGAAALLFLFAPLLAAVALLIGLDSPGPVIFPQRRTGWGGRSFTIYKFRTMKHAPGEESARRQTARRDARLTRVGGFLRSASLDELPQLWNVLRGDMSLVGPRPHADSLHVGERAGLAMVAEYARRQRVKPGMTGWAQVNGWRGAATDPAHLRARIEHDLYYIDHWSLLFDLRIVAMTPLRVLSRRNAY